MQLDFVSPEHWKQLASAAHLVVFDEHWDEMLERISYAIIMLTDKKEMVAYATIQLIDNDTAYLQYGGAFPTFKGTSIVFKAFQTMINCLKSKYKKLVTMIENDNYPMLKFYMKENFLITGIRYFNGFTLLENSYET